MQAIGRYGILVLCALGACGDNLVGTVPLVPSHDLVVVAHQDDDLIFMQPDQMEAVTHGVGVTTLYITAGNASAGADAADARYAGLMQTYGAMVNDYHWQCGYIFILGHAMQHCRLSAANLSLVFLAYPDGGRHGETASSLLHMWEGSVTSATTIAHVVTTYAREQLINAVAEIVRQTQPATVRTLEVAATHGDDHPDHMIAAALLTLAMARTDSQAELVSYRGYNIGAEPANKLAPIYDASRSVLSRYEACATGCAPCGESCADIDPTHEAWLARRYAVGFRRAARGALQIGDRCLRLGAGASVSLGDCTAAPLWTLDAGRLASDAGCLDVQADGALTLNACTTTSSQRFLIDDEDHLWSGVPPTPQADMYFDHLWCLSPTDTGPRAVLCGKSNAPVWRVVPALAFTPRSTLNLAATGRAVRLGDLDGDGRADLCAVDADGLYCAHGLGTGQFGGARQIAGPSFPVEPDSLTLGDVDGDGRGDACGRDVAGVLCALSSRGFAVTRFTSAFGAADNRPGTSASLVALEGNGDGIADICGLDTAGVECAPAGNGQLLNLSSWPDGSAVVLPADFDGDDRADWCAITANGPACAVRAESALSRDGGDWGFAFEGKIAPVPGDPAVVGAADIDGDGKSDLCALDGSRIACMRSQGRGFGPLFTFATIPAGATALWLGDLDGDGRADACADLGTSIACALAH